MDPDPYRQGQNKCGSGSAKHWWKVIKTTEQCRAHVNLTVHKSSMQNISLCIHIMHLCIVQCTCAEQSRAHVHCVVHMCGTISCTCAGCSAHVRNNLVHMCIVQCTCAENLVHMCSAYVNLNVQRQSFFAHVHTNDSNMYRKSYTHCTHILDLITHKL